MFSVDFVFTVSSFKHICAFHFKHLLASEGDWTMTLKWLNLIKLKNVWYNTYWINSLGLHSHEWVHLYLSIISNITELINIYRYKTNEWKKKHIRRAELLHNINSSPKFTFPPYPRHKVAQPTQAKRPSTSEVMYWSVIQIRYDVTNGSTINNPFPVYPPLCRFLSLFAQLWQ